MNATAIKVTKKVCTFLATVGLPMACSYFENKNLEAKMRKIAAEVVANAKKD